jgi:hypothetical protein
MTFDTSLRPVSTLIEDMTVRGFNEHTRRDYVRHVRSFAAFIGRSSDTAMAEDLRFFCPTRSDIAMSHIRNFKGYLPLSERWHRGDAA